MRQVLRYHERFLQSCRQSTDYVSTAYTAGRSVKETEGSTVLLKVHAALGFHEENLRRVVDDNKHMMRFLLKISGKKLEERANTADTE